MTRITAGWRTRIIHDIGTRDDYEVYRGHIVRAFVEGHVDQEAKEAWEKRALEHWRASPHYDGRDD